MPRCVDCKHLQLERGTWRYWCPQINDYLPRDHVGSDENCIYFEEIRSKIFKAPVEIEENPLE